MCPTYKKVKRGVFVKIEKLKNCEICKKITDKKICDKFFHYLRGRVLLTIDKDIETKEPIRKLFTGETEEALESLYKYKISMKKSGNDLDTVIQKTTKSIIDISPKIENSKFRKGKKGDAYRTNMATLNNFAN